MGCLPDDVVDLVDDVPQFVVGVGGRQLQLKDEAVDLVDADGDSQALLQSVLDQPLRVQHHLQITSCLKTNWALPMSYIFSNHFAIFLFENKLGTTVVLYI